MKEELAVKKSVTVNAPQKHVFTVFTEGHGSWWPLETHHIGAQTPETVIIEPRAGGRWFERAADGTECDWGRVLLWEPFDRLILSWKLSAQVLSSVWASRTRSIASRRSFDSSSFRSG